MTHPASRNLSWSDLNRPPERCSLSPGGLDWSRHPGKVCIYGAGMGRECAPLDDPEWVVWGLNLVLPLDRSGKVRADAWFDIHQRMAQTHDDMRWISSCPVPIYVPDDLVDANPNCIRFPYEQIVSMFGPAYFTCTFAYQIALAIAEGFSEIGLFGVELRFGSERERTVEWACTSFWMGMAVARGVTITVPSGSWLASHPAAYGLQYEKEISEVNRYLETVRFLDASGATGGNGG